METSLLTSGQIKTRDSRGVSCSWVSTDWWTGRGSGRDGSGLASRRPTDRKSSLSLMKSAFFSFFSLPWNLKSFPGFAIPNLKNEVVGQYGKCNLTDSWHFSVYFYNKCLIWTFQTDWVLSVWSHSCIIRTARQK